MLVVSLPLTDWSVHSHCQTPIYCLCPTVWSMGADLISHREAKRSVYVCVCMDRHRRRHQQKTWRSDESPDNERWGSDDRRPLDSQICFLSALTHHHSGDPTTYYNWLLYKTANSRYTTHKITPLLLHLADCTCASGKIAGTRFSSGFEHAVCSASYKRGDEKHIWLSRPPVRRGLICGGRVSMSFTSPWHTWRSCGRALWFVPQMEVVRWVRVTNYFASNFLPLLITFLIFIIAEQQLGEVAAN